MGRKLDLSGLTDNEAEHVLQVVQRDMTLRRKEEERLSELKQELDKEGSRCLLLSRQSCFNQRCCIRCCTPFTFLLNPKRQCRDCLYNVCKACRVYNKQDKAWLCSACQRSRLLKTQSLEWFYTNVKTRFKRFGSAKVLKTLYRKHLVEHSALAEPTEGYAYEESICNEGSVCGSDSTFYRQTEEHSMEETLTVALRVAEEAIDEAISKAEFDTASQEKQNEAHYLREHRGELVEELAKTIVQKIISRRKTLADIKAEYDQDWPLEHSTDLHHHHQSAGDQACSSFKHQPGLWRSHSAFSLLDKDSPGLVQETHPALKKEGGGSDMSTWTSLDRLDNPGVSSVLKSPDGNWIALQSVQLSRPNLLTKRKSLVYSALERESGLVSAYEGMGFDNETTPRTDSSRAAVLQEIHRKMTDSNFNLQDTEDRISLQLLDRRGSRDDLFSDSEGNWKPAQIRQPSSAPRTSIIDVNFNVEGAGDESSAAAEPAVGKVKRSQKKRKSNKESAASSPALDFNKKDNQSQHTSDAVTPDTLTSGATTPEFFNLESDITGHGANQMEQELTLKLQQLAGRVSDSSTRNDGLHGVRDADDDAQSEERRQGNKDKDEDERLWRTEIELDDGGTEDEKDEEKDVDEEKMKDRLYRLVAQSRITYLSSTDDELDRAGLSEGEWDRERDEDMEVEYKEQKEEKTEGLTYKLCQLKTVVGAERREERTEEIIALYETRFGRENQPEAKWSEKKEGEERQEEKKIRESKQNQRKWEMASDNEEEDAEFDRIIGSMLMMTLEDMQVEMIKDKGENGGMKRESEEVETDEGQKVDSKTDETGGAKERAGENISEKTAGDISAKQESGDATGRNKNEQQDKDTDPQEKRLAKEKPTDMTSKKTRQTCKTMEVDDENTRGEMTTEWQMMETQGDAAEGECESKDTDERLKETKDDVEQSCTSSLQEGLLSPEEIQNEKQNEAHYLREHRGELVEELAKTIVQKIISRRKTLADIKAEYDQDWPLEHSTDLHHHHQSAGDQACSSFKHQPGLWRSHSAFSLLDKDSPGLVQETHPALKKEGGGSDMSTWTSLDRLDNPGVSSVLKSPDGNWIALQSAQLSRPNLLTKRKSLVYSALERESGVVSAYEGMGSDNETKPEPESSWATVLQEIHRKMTDSNFNLQDTEDRISLQLLDRRGSRDDLFSDSEGNWKPAQIRQPSSAPRTSIIDVNFNVEGAGDESSAAAEPAVGKVKRSQKKRKSNKESAASSPALDYNKKDNQSQHTSDAVTPDTLTSGATTPELFNLESDITGHGANQMEQELTLNLQLLAGRVSDSSTRDDGLHGVRDADDDAQSEERRQGNEDKDEEDERLWRTEIELDDGRTEDEKEGEEKDVDEEDMKGRLYRLIAQSRFTYFSSTDDELDRAGLSEGEWDRERDEDMEVEYKEEKTKGLTYKLCQLEKEVRATQFSSTEDELDRVGITDEEKKTGEEEEELAVKVCRLANQVNATQFSSTEDELDGTGEEGEEAIDEVTLWKLQAQKAVQVAQVRGGQVASLVSASQFSSTEDELDRFGENEGEIEHEVNEGGIDSSIEMEEVWEGAVRKSQERRESIGDLDVKMFDLREEVEERKNKRSEGKVEKATTENVLDCQIKFEDVQPEKTKIEEPEDCMEERVTEETEDERMVGKVEVFKETGERQEMQLKTVVEAERREERTEEIIALFGTRYGLENQPEAKWSDKKEREERQEEKKIRESKQSQRKWEMASDNEEEDEEFDRIIRSMLMMTLEDMQVEMIKDKGENGGMKRESEEVETEEGEKVDSKTDETGGAKERAGENKSEKTAGDISAKQESGDATGRNKNEQQDKDTDPQEKRLAKEKPTDMTSEKTRQTCKTMEVDDENTRGEMTTEWQMMETQGDAAEGECESKDTDERLKETKDDMEQSCTSSLQEGLLSPEEIQNGNDMELYKTTEFISTLLQQRYSAVSLRSITTEVLKVLNATEELLQGVEGGDGPRLSTTSLPPNTDPKKLDQQFSRLEENAYVAAGTVYSLEAELSDLEECARGICSTTSNMELSFLEEQVASAAAKVQQSELQICDISARIAALRSAGLNVDPQSCFPKTRTIPVTPVTLDSSRQLRRRLPAPPVKEDKET